MKRCTAKIDFPSRGLVSSRLGLAGVLPALLVGLFAASGCDGAGDAQLRAIKQRFVLAEEPAAAVSIEAAIAGLEHQPEVTIAGRINAGTSEPFEPAEATLVLSEAPDPAHNHDPGDCPFCKKRLENAKSCIVRFLDSDGNVIKQGAQTLLGVSKDQDVVVTGLGKIVPGIDVFQVDASGIFIRPVAKQP